MIQRVTGNTTIVSQGPLLTSYDGEYCKNGVESQGIKAAACRSIELVLAYQVPADFMLDSLSVRT